ncbi:MAG: hypothetical protein H6618_04335 [Deltaproteobacteria bacterium]|nr:hypothetical protein [Deltaproteobacteria bacterium]
MKRHIFWSGFLFCFLCLTNCAQNSGKRALRDVTDSPSENSDAYLSLAEETQTAAKEYLQSSEGHEDNNFNQYVLNLPEIPKHVLANFYSREETADLSNEIGESQTESEKKETTK